MPCEEYWFLALDTVKSGRKSPKFRRKCCPFFSSKLETAGSSETSISFYNLHGVTSRKWNVKWMWSNYSTKLSSGIAEAGEVQEKCKLGWVWLTFLRRVAKLCPELFLLTRRMSIDFLQGGWAFFLSWRVQGFVESCSNVPMCESGPKAKLVSAWSRLAHHSSVLNLRNFSLFWAPFEKRLLASPCLSSVRPSVHMEQLGLPLDGFSWNFILVYFKKSV
jgi:hypothetical protein